MGRADFGSAFGRAWPPDEPRRELGDGDDEILRITFDDIELLDDREGEAALEPLHVEPAAMTPHDYAAEHYHVDLRAPDRNEDLYVGMVRNQRMRTEEEDYWPLFGTTPRRRQNQILTFEVEVADREGNPLEYVPVEVRGQEISGVLPSDGTPVAVYGQRDRRDGIVRTYKVLNLRSRSSLTVVTRGKDSCLVATAAFGSIDAPEVRVLRRWRDGCLRRTAPGRGLVRLYYRASPPVADWVSRDAGRRRRVRRVLRAIARGLAWALPAIREPQPPG
jgi:hypothetical protein